MVTACAREDSGVLPITRQAMLASQCVRRHIMRTPAVESGNQSPSDSLSPADRHGYGELAAWGDYFASPDGLGADFPESLLPEDSDLVLLAGVVVLSASALFL